MHNTEITEQERLSLAYSSLKERHLEIKGFYTNQTIELNKAKTTIEAQKSQIATLKDADTTKYLTQIRNLKDRITQLLVTIKTKESTDWRAKALNSARDYAELVVYVKSKRLEIPNHYNKISEKQIHLTEQK